MVYIICGYVKAKEDIVWLDSNFIPMDSKKFEYKALIWAMKIYIKNESETKNLRSRDFQKMFEIFS